jgi:hypothetical protein
LGPSVETFVGGAHASACIVSQSKSSQLASHIGDVRLGVLSRVHTGGDGMLLGGQSERVVAECVQHVEAVHSLEAAEHVGTDVAEWVSHVQTCARRIGEHVEDEELVSAGDLGRFGERPGRIRRLEGSLNFPAILPLGLDLGCQTGVVALFWRGIARGHLHLA